MQLNNQHIYELSSGTIASISGYTKYTDIDKVKNKLVTFISNSAKIMHTWAEVWKEFDLRYNQHPNTKFETWCKDITLIKPIS